MIIDSHLHIGNMLNFDLPAELIISAMEKYKIDFGIVSNLEGAEFDHGLNLVPDEYQHKEYEINLKSVELVKKYPQKLKAQYWIKPFTEGYSPKVENFILENRKYICGLKCHPFHSKTKFSDEKIIPYLELAKRHKLSFASHTSGDIYSDPEVIYNVAKRYPEINFIMVHMGLGTDNQKAIKLISQLDNLYGDTTWVSVEHVIQAIKVCGSKKILFGTDAIIDGIDTHAKYQLMIERIRETFTKEESEDVLFRNSKKLFEV